MQINKERYVNTWGKEPKGYGSWAFEVRTWEKGQRVTLTEHAHGTYTEALAAVKRRLLGRGDRNNIEIIVLP